MVSLGFLSSSWEEVVAECLVSRKAAGELFSACPPPSLVNRRLTLSVPLRSLGALGTLVLTSGDGQKPHQV
jgi:hypothetical protein